jgi:hypothetical protein
MLFATTVHNYKSNKTRIVNVNTERLNALFDMESFVIGFIMEQDGSTINLSGRRFEKRAFDSPATRAQLPEGHYVVSNCTANRDFTKIVVWRKFTDTVTEKGWFGRTYQTSTAKWDKVMSVFITEYDSSATTVPSGNQEYTPVSTRGYKFQSPASIRKRKNNPFVLDKSSSNRFIKSFSDLGSTNMLRKVYYENISLPADKQSVVTVSMLRTKYRNEFTKCPLANQKRVFLDRIAGPETTQERLCASILMHCKDIRIRSDEHVVPVTVPTPVSVAQPIPVPPPLPVDQHEE